MFQDKIEEAAELIQQADAILITSGAGMGVDSGLPDFRGNNGFWKEYPVLKNKGLSFMEMANPYYFQSQPQLAWAFYGHRLNLYRETMPHEGFNHLLEWCKAKKNGHFIFTSNVDGQFQKAGFAANSIEECHGSIHFLQCMQNCGDMIWSAKDTLITIDSQKFKALKPLPKCAGCGGYARPNILMFGDGGWNSHRADEQNDNFYNWEFNMAKQSKNAVIIELGAGQVIPTVRWTSEQFSHKHKAPIIRINPRDYQVPSGNIGLSLGAADALNQIAAAM